MFGNQTCQSINPLRLSGSGTEEEWGAGVRVGELDIKDPIVDIDCI